MRSKSLKKNGYTFLDEVFWCAADESLDGVVEDYGLSDIAGP
jgi:hypothetical protein